MKQHIFLFLFLIPFLSFANERFQSNLHVAKEMAATEGKLIMLDFTASWCAPCKFMDEYTFTDGRVNNYFQASFVPVKIDIDDFDGFALKQTYNVQVLPTIVFLDSQGNLLAKYEESMAPSRLLQLMETHDLPSNKIITRTAIDPMSPSSAPVDETTIIRPPLGDTNDIPVNTSPSGNSYPTAPSEPQIPEPQAPTNSLEAPLITGNGLFKFNVEPQPSYGYSVQIGAFYEYENVLIQVSQLQQQYDYIIVNANRLNGNAVYKILLGYFENADAARDFSKELATSGMTGGFMVDLSTLK